MTKKTVSIVLSSLMLLAHLAVPTSQGLAFGQAVAELRGIVTDETGAVVAAAPVVLDDGKGRKYTAATDEQGRYRFTGLQPGKYQMTVETEGFGKFSDPVDLTTRRTATLDIVLKVFIAEQIEIKSDAAGVSSDPDRNLSAITLTEKDLLALPEDPDELLEQLKQMAGAAGATGDVAVYVGGFRERGRIPPRDAILRVQMNSNPFSAEFNEPGHSRIEIITKPGSDTIHGGLRFTFMDESLNSRDADSLSKAPLQRRVFGGNFSGPIIRNRWGYFIDFDRNENDESEIINAVTLNPNTFRPESFISSFATPNRRNSFGLRTEYLLSKKHTLGFQYRVSRNNREDLGGEFDLPERATNRSSGEDTLRFSLTTIATEHAVNEMRLQLNRRSSTTQAVSEAIGIVVNDSFRGGGNQNSLFSTRDDETAELNNNVTYSYKKHTFKAGFRAEGMYVETLNRANFGGEFTFGSDSGLAPLDLYSRVLRGDPGFRPSQFRIAKGDPFASLNQWNMSLFFQDDWRASPQLTLSYGLRQQFQTNLQDKINLAPRFGFAYADKGRKGAIRGGIGLFYDELDSNITFDTIRFDGQHQQLFTVIRPDFFAVIPDVLTGANTVLPTIRSKAEDLKAPYMINSTIGYDRQLGSKISGSINYSWQRSLHQLRTRNINAPTGFDGNDPIYPFPDQGPLFVYESTGVSNRHQLTVGGRIALTQATSFGGFYTLGRTMSDVDGSGSSPANPYNFFNEYSRSSGDARHTFRFFGSFSMPWGLRVSPMIALTSGRPFNITTGSDNNLDTLFLDRPAFANPGDPGAIVTPLGVFNPNPGPGDIIIPRNFGEGPGRVEVSTSFSKTFGFGPERTQPRAAAGNNQQRSRGGQQNSRSGGGNPGFGGGGPMMIPMGGAHGGGGGMRGPGGFGGGGGFFGGDNRKKYGITLNVQVNNLFNHPNPNNYIGTLRSPFFGTYNRVSGGRRIETALRFNF